MSWSYCLCSKALTKNLIQLQNKFLWSNKIWHFLCCIFSLSLSQSAIFGCRSHLWKDWRGFRKVCRVELFCIYCTCVFFLLHLFQFGIEFQILISFFFKAEKHWNSFQLSALCNSSLSRWVCIIDSWDLNRLLIIHGRHGLFFFPFVQVMNG